MKNRTNVSAEPEELEIIITREFDAPRELVFQAFTDPTLYVQWLGPRRFIMTIETFEPKNGGRWRYIHRDQNGNAYAFHGVYHEVLAPELIIDTFEFEGLPEKGHVGLETIKSGLSLNKRCWWDKVTLFASNERIRKRER
ncbi:MAG TPA: SRPBCC domain-containing protein, partial [Ktedonobacteraceae bacterium]|nr:SRPBCC domain-containing protein [Ktedonobacteraceae bacterium]